MLKGLRITNKYSKTLCNASWTIEVDHEDDEEDSDSDSSKDESEDNAISLNNSNNLNNE